MGDEVGPQRGEGYSSRLKAWIAAAVLLAGFSLVLFVNLRSEPPSRQSEKRCIYVVGGMVESGDWLVPRVGPTPRLQKPPLFYWVGAATASALGDAGPIAVRLPSALAAVGLVALVMSWGHSLGGRGMGLAAGAALVAMVQVAASGRRGDAEMQLALLCVAALFAFDRLHSTQRRAWLPVFGVLAGLALLTKATAVLPIVILPILAFLALRRELPRLRDAGALSAGGLAIAIGVSWYAVILAVVPGAFESFWHDLVTPLGVAPVREADAQHLRPIWWYLESLPARSAPASLLLPVVIWRLWRTRVYRDAPRLRFAALAFLVPFVAFSLLPQKQRHYTLPMLPGLALLCAESVTALAPVARAWLTRALGTPLALGGLAVTGLLALFFVWVEGRSAPGVASAALILGGLFAVALAAALRGRAAGFALAWVPAFLLIYALHRTVVVLRLQELQAFRELTLDERERLYTVAREHPWFVDVFKMTRGAHELD